MSDPTIRTVTGTTTAAALGRTLMHEHLVIGYPGWESHSTRPGLSRDEMFAVCVDRIEEIKSHGVTSLLDPCPNDLGRDVDLMAKVAQHTNFQIICATGLYKEEEGGAAYWKFRQNFGDASEAMAELFVSEIEHGIGGTDVRAGIIKVATGNGVISDYEKTVLNAAALASNETGTPITTHTDQGTMGDEQQRILTAAGVPAERIVIGHSCGSTDHDYHMAIARGGSYLGFDRFGLDMLTPDEKRIESLVRLIRSGAGDRVVVSHDSVWCWRAEPIPNPSISAAMTKIWNPTHFFERIIPRLRDCDVSDAEIDRLLVENPRRFFSGEPLPAIR